MYISSLLQILVPLLFVVVISNGEPAISRPIKPAVCVKCLVYWSKEQCDAMGKDHVEATCNRCSECVDRVDENVKPAVCVQCFKYWSKEECNAMGKDQVEATCDHCSKCVDRPCIACLWAPSAEFCESQGQVLRPYSCYECAACVDAVDAIPVTE